MQKIKRILMITAFLMMGACSHQNPLSNMRFQTITAPPHIMASWYKITAPGEPLRIYVEGDSHPTPQDDFVRRLAAEDPHPNVAYLGLPCQYLQVACSNADWTTDRFSNRNVQSVNLAIMSLMQKAGASELILIGYLDGIKMSELISMQYPKENMRLITIPNEDVDPQKIYEVKS